MMFSYCLWSVYVNRSRGVNISHLQPNYPVVMPIWITENSEKFIVDLIAELNMAEEPSASSQSTPASHTHLVQTFNASITHILFSPFHIKLLAVAESTVFSVSSMSLEWQSSTPSLGSTTQSRVFSTSESICKGYIIITSSPGVPHR